jgi:hypothetical protein|tara:strand:+ start:3027 stop:3602 length:576 start_codon:yes stop_codon:yes gene_type:complete
MSIDSARVFCTGCDYETREVYRPVRIRYQMANGKTIETGRSKGWCFDCSGYSDIEKIDEENLREDLVSKERERREQRGRLLELDSGLLAGLRHRSERRRLKYSIERLDEDVAELAGLLEIAKGRKARARCLKCWSDRTAPLSFDSADDVAHDFRHECGGNLKIVHDHAGPRFHFAVATYVLNEEGELLGQE